MLGNGARQRQPKLLNEQEQASSQFKNKKMPKKLYATFAIGLAMLLGLLLLSQHINGVDVKEHQGTAKRSPKKNQNHVFHKEFYSSKETVHLLLQMPSLTPSYQNAIQRYHENFEWLLAFSSVPLHLHLVVPEESFEITDQILAKANNSIQIPFQVTKYGLQKFNSRLEGIVRSEFGQNNDFAEIVANRMPTLVLSYFFPQLKQLIVIESSVMIRADIADLAAHFKHFNSEQLIGIVQQQVPKYRESFELYEKYKPGSGLGTSSKPGFNSALLIIDCHKMRHSMKMNAYLHDATLRRLVHKFFFTKHSQSIITQDDIFTLIGYEHPELFFILPCGWNRQLESANYNLPREYNQCDGKIYAEFIEEE